MNTQTIYDLPFPRDAQEENTFWAGFGYITLEALVYCPMCEDRHENNTNCQRMG